MRFHRIKMRYSIVPRDRIYVKGYGFLSFAKNIGKNLSNKYGQKLLESAKKSTTDSIKATSERAIQNTAEATGDLTGTKISYEITNVSKKSLVHLQIDDASNETEAPEKDTYLQKKGNELLMS